MPGSRFEFTLFADYFQFYLQDESSQGDLSESWTPEAVQRLVATAPGAIGVGTVRNMNVPVTVEIVQNPPLDESNDWDQINECSIDVPSGRLVVAGCTDYFPDAARIELIPGTYRARIYYANLSQLNPDDLEGKDFYKIVLWPGTREPTRVIIQRSQPEK